MYKRLRIQTMQHIKQNILLYLIIVFAFLTGIASGSFTAGGMTETQRQGLGGYLQHFFGVIANQSIDKGAIFWESLWQHIQFGFLLWLSGIFFFGLPFVLILVGMRGFFIGFTVGFLLSHYGFGGFLFTLICILPQTLLYIPSFIGMGVFALEYSIKKFRNRKISYSKENSLKNMSPYTLKMMIFFLVLLVGSIIEAFVTPLFFRMFSWIFT